MNLLARGFRQSVHRGGMGQHLTASLFTFAWQVYEVVTGAKMSVNGAQQQITHAVTQWTETTVAPHRFGGVEYLLGTREIGHIHGDTLVDIPFPKAVRNELVEAGQARPHHILPESGWISFYIREPSDISKAIDLLQRSYQLAVQQAARRHVNQQANQKVDNDN